MHSERVWLRRWGLNSQSPHVPAELYLQELCGHEELAIEGVHTAAVVALLNRLLLIRQYLT